MKNIILRIFSWSFLCIVFIYYYITPFTENSSSGILCTFKLLTSYSCTGCGTQRSLHQLLHFHIKDAFFLNALFVLGFPFFLYLYFILIEIYITKTQKPDGFFFSSKTGISILIIVILFAILRNLHFYPFTLFKS